MRCFADRLPNNEKGMTLLEVLAALVLLLIITTSILSVFTSASMWIRQARNETTASNYAQAVLENLRADRTQVAAANNGKSADAIWPGHSYKPAGSPIMITELSIVGRADASHLFNVGITVNWSEGNQPRSLVLLTVMRNQ